MEFLCPEDNDPNLSGMLQTVRMETETMPPLVELGRKLLSKAQEGDTEAVRDLMSQGAPFTADWLGTSAIHWACQLNHYDTAELLLKAGISRDARNKVDRTPLHVTATEGHVRILKLLLQHGVDVDAVDMLRMTPLHWAAEYGHEECVRLLLEHGADPLALNKFDKTADQIAFDNNRIEITHMIQEYAENPMFQMRRIAAKEKQKQAAAAHKANVDKERAQIMKYNSHSNADKPGEVKATTKVQRCKPRIVYDSLPNSAENEVIIGPPPPSPPSTEKTMAMLQAHGITMLPNDESSIVASAMQSGQKVVLTEAGKMALTLTQSPTVKPQTTLPIKGLVRLPPDLLRGKKVITIRADQLINMKNERKVIIQTAKTANKLIGETTPSKAKVEVLVTKKIINNKAQLMSSVVHKPTELESVPSVIVPPVVESQVVRRIEGGSEVDRLKRELDEAKQQLKLLREQYLRKEKEADEYKQILGVLKSK